jgi:glyoxylase-like metal-dependent hydrolase (beta-lactamase superfamily II)
VTVRLYALNCGTLEFERHAFFPDAAKGVAMRVPVPAFLVVHPKGKLLFDTGIHADGFSDPVAHYGKGLAGYFKFHCAPGEGVAAQLRLLGLAPDDITHVVNSHFHFDHCGCNALFRRAEFFVQGEEMRFTRATQPRREADGRRDRDWDVPGYRLLEGEHDLFGDGEVVIVPTPGHTAGHQSLRVNAGSGLRFCLTGDACYTEEHLEKDLLPTGGAVWKADEMRRSLGVLRRLRDRESVALIYGHDAAQLRSLRRCPEAFA